MVKVVDITADRKIYGVLKMPIVGKMNSVRLSSNQIYKCLADGARVEEILPNGNRLLLNAHNYNTENYTAPKPNVVDEAEKIRKEQELEKAKRIEEAAKRAEAEKARKKAEEEAAKKAAEEAEAKRLAEEAKKAEEEAKAAVDAEKTEAEEAPVDPEKTEAAAEDKPKNKGKSTKK